MKKQVQFIYSKISAVYKCRKRIWEEIRKRYNGINLYHEIIGDRFSFFVPDFLNFPQYAYICNYCCCYYYLNIRNRFYLSP